MRDTLLKNICDLENWLQGDGKKWYWLPVRVAGFFVLLAALLASNLAAVVTMPFSFWASSGQPGKRIHLEELPDAALDIGDAEFHQALEKYSQSVPVLVDFWAPWCGPCLLMKPALSEVCAARQGRLVVFAVNSTRATSTTSEFNVAGLPTLVLLSKNEEIARNVGALDLQSLNEFLDANLPT